MALPLGLYHLSANIKMDKRSIPEAVKEAASFILSYEDGIVEYIGMYKGKEIYIACLKDGASGFPEVYSFAGMSATELPTSEGMRLIGLLCED